MSVVLYNRFQKVLLASFDDQLAARAHMVAQKTSVLPKVIPLPQGEENFTIIYLREKNTDTLFVPVTVPFSYPSARDSVATDSGWRIANIYESLETGGKLQVIFALPAEGINKRIRQMEILIFLVLPAGLLLAILIAYWLSNSLLKPVRQVINLANATNINNDVELLTEPGSDDELKELIVSFNRMLLRIKEQSNRQTAFFASASHELRTPLSVMQTRLEVMMQVQASEEMSKVYSEQLKEVQRLTKMVNDFLLLSELRSGTVIITKTTVSLSEIITNTIARYKSKWTHRELQFKILYEPVEANYEVLADESRLKIIFDNLVDNAIKYSPESAVVDILVRADDRGFLITITNSIRYDINPRISDLKNEFYHSKPLHGEGFGLGLWISSQLATLQDIELSFTIRDKEQFSISLILEPNNLSNFEM